MKKILYIIFVLCLLPLVEAGTIGQGVQFDCAANNVTYETCETVTFNTGYQVTGSSFIIDTNIHNILETTLTTHYLFESRITVKESSSGASLNNVNYIITDQEGNSQSGILNEYKDFILHDDLWIINTVKDGYTTNDTTFDFDCANQLLTIYMPVPSGGYPGSSSTPGSAPSVELEEINDSAIEMSVIGNLTKKKIQAYKTPITIGAFSWSCAIIIAAIVLLAFMIIMCFKKAREYIKKHWVWALILLIVIIVIIIMLCYLDLF